MKRKLLCLIAVLIPVSLLQAQVIYDNGPMVNFPGGGFNNADVSHIHDGMNLYGSNNNFALGYRMADDFVIPAWESWTIDSLITFGYQTNSTNTSTFSELNFRIWDGVPDEPGSNIVFGDNATNVLATSDWSGIYRTGDFTSTQCEPLTCVARPIMRNAAVAGITLTGGTYWVDWSTAGTLTSGPWCPYVNLGVGVTTTGNSLQYVEANLAWQPITDTVPANAANEPQGLPFQLTGSIVITGVHSPEVNQYVSIYPNPVTEKAWVNISLPLQSGSTYTFELFDMVGKKVYTMNDISTNKFELNRGSLSKGVYTYVLKNDNAPVSQGKLVFN